MATDDPDDLHDEFMAYIEAYESTEPQSLFEVLPETGISLPPPDALDDAALTTKLWEVIHGLSLLGTFLHNTDHLSDRELYAALWSDLLREPTVIMPDNTAFACHIDIIGSGSEEDIFLSLKYYADEESRQDWLKDWPEDGLPEHEAPPYDRDCRLPKAESRRDGFVM
jgi:hypothetical protein